MQDDPASFTFREMVSGWIGLNDIAREGNFIWRYPIWNITRYRNWYKNEPNGGRSENCVELIAGLKYFLQWNGRWNDKSCDERMSFICQKMHKRTGLYKHTNDFSFYVLCIRLL